MPITRNLGTPGTLKLHKFFGNNVTMRSPATNPILHIRELDAQRLNAHIPSLSPCLKKLHMHVAT